MRTAGGPRIAGCEADSELYAPRVRWDSVPPLHSIDRRCVSHERSAATQRARTVQSIPLTFDAEERTSRHCGFNPTELNFREVA